MKTFSKRWFQHHAPALAWCIGALLGGSLASMHALKGDSDTLATILKDAKGWEWSAFAAFGTMSGFALAALALVAAVASHERAKATVDSNDGRLMLRILVQSTWLWLLCALLALVHMGAPGKIVQCILLVFTSIAALRALLALYAFSLFYKRFTLPKPE